MTRTAEPGWYRDPAGAPLDRWWDGAVWTTYTQPLGLADYQQRMMRSSQATGTLARLVLWVIGGVVGLVVLVFIAAAISVAIH